jgi:hypothetical protein
MSSHLTFTSPTNDDLQRRPLAFLEPEEFLYMATALVQRLKEGSMPPDDAYWWTRALCAEPYLRLRTNPSTGEPFTGRPEAEWQCRVA